MERNLAKVEIIAGVKKDMVKNEVVELYKKAGIRICREQARDILKSLRA
jgi:hypothetical protein